MPSLALALLLLSGATAVLAADGERSAPAVTCRLAAVGDGSFRPPGPRDLEIGPLRLVSVRNTPRWGLNAFGGHGFKIPAGLPDEVIATLSVPRRLYGRVGFVYTQRTQRRVLRRGVSGANRRVTFKPCRHEPPGMTGWPGGIVVDRRRCATLRVRVRGAVDLVTRRVPLGRRCRKR